MNPRRTRITVEHTIGTTSKGTKWYTLSSMAATTETLLPWGRTDQQDGRILLADKKRQEVINKRSIKNVVTIKKLDSSGKCRCRLLSVCAYKTKQQ